MRKLLTVFVLGVLFLLATNPGPELHRTRYREQFKAAHPIASFFGAAQLGGAALSYHSYGLFSVTSLGGGLTTVGVAGFVIVSPER